jgi:hypothetical protein
VATESLASDHYLCVLLPEPRDLGLTGLAHAGHARSHGESFDNSHQLLLSVRNKRSNAAYNILIDHFPTSPSILREIDILSFDPGHVEDARRIV